MSEFEINQQAAQQICDSNRHNGKHYQTGEWLALLDGKVVAVANDLDVALQALRKLDANPDRGMILEFGVSIPDVIR